MDLNILWRRFGFGRRRPTYKTYPNVTSQDVGRIIQRDFADRSIEAKDAINKFHSQWPGEHARVHLACLKLADGDLEKLKRMIDAANLDFRDVLLWAHHPEENRRMGPYSKLTKTEDEAIVDRDWKQYLDWLTK